jgi:hypothetical protein
MGIVFGLFVIVILIAALLNRRRQSKAWVQEERHDESGAWVDKRAGERGTYGSLDVEMEQSRRNLTRQGRANDLSRLLRDYAFENYPGFHTLSDAQIKSYSNFVKNQVVLLLAVIEHLLDGQAPDPVENPPSEAAYHLALKKQILDFSYQHFPALLDLEIETIKQFDLYVGNLSNTLTEKIEEIKG